MSDETPTTPARIRPPIDETRKALEAGARKIATLMARRARHVKRVEDIEAELSQARRFLRDLIKDVSAPSALAPQTRTEEEL